MTFLEAFLEVGTFLVRELRDVALDVAAGASFAEAILAAASFVVAVVSCIAVVVVATPSYLAAY